MDAKADEPGIEPTANSHATVLPEGDVTVGVSIRTDTGTIIKGKLASGDHALIHRYVRIGGTKMIATYAHICDNVNTEGGRPAKLSGPRADMSDRSVIGDGFWINRGATVHGTQAGNGGAVRLNACCDYNTRIRKGASPANSSATRVDQVVPDNRLAEGVAATIRKEGLTEDDRLAYFGVLPSACTHYEAGKVEADIRKRMGLSNTGQWRGPSLPPTAVLVAGHIEGTFRDEPAR